MTDVLSGEQPIGEKKISEAMAVLEKYKSAKASLDKRIIDNEEWYKLGHWKQYGNRVMEGKRAPSTGWLFNSIANKHADAMDNYPEPNVLPRAQDDEETASSSPRSCRWCWNRPTTRACTVTPGGASSSRVPA